MNIGLTSGSEILRRKVLRRPKYSNSEVVTFSLLTKEYGIDLNFYVLIGVPGETLANYKETLSLVRQSMPKMVFLSIFYPYLGTDLYSIAVERGLIHKDGLNSCAERSRAALDLPEFSRNRIRLEYVLFWYKVYRGYWPMSKIVVETMRGIINGSPRVWSTYGFLQKTIIFKWLKQLYNKRLANFDQSLQTSLDRQQFRYIE